MKNDKISTYHSSFLCIHAPRFTYILSLLCSNNTWQKAEVGKGEGGIEKEGELFPLMMTDGLYLDDATHPVGDGGGCQGKAKEGVGRYLGFDNCCNCGRTRSVGDKFHIIALAARESML